MFSITFPKQRPCRGCLIFSVNSYEKLHNIIAASQAKDSRVTEPGGTFSEVFDGDSVTWQSLAREAAIT